MLATSQRGNEFSGLLKSRVTFRLNSQMHEFAVAQPVEVHLRTKSEKNDGRILNVPRFQDNYHAQDERQSFCFVVHQ